MFHNYKLAEKDQTYAGVDIYWAKKGKAMSWELWTRMAIGILYSPFATTSIFMWGMEVIIGDHKYEANPLYWYSVVQNCLGTNEYDPSMPRLYRWDSKLQGSTSLCKTFVDDSRSVEAIQKLVRDTTHSFETVMGYLGLQDTTRKRHPNPQLYGDWTGYIKLAL